MTERPELRSIDRYGRFVLLAVYISLLAGRFTFSRLGALPAWDVRWGFAVVVGVLALTWATVAREVTTKTGTGALFAWFLAWAAWMAVSAGWAPDGARIGADLLDFGLLTGLTWAAWGAAGRVHPRVLGAVWWWLYLTGWLYFAGAVAAGPGVQGRYSAFGGGPNVFVRVMGLAFLATLVLAATRRKRWVLLGLPAFLLGAYLSGSRGGLIALLVIAVIGGPVLVRRMGGRVAAALGIGALPLVLLGVVFYDPAWLTFGQERFIQQTFGQGYDSERTAIAGRALQLFESHPWNGTGLDGFYALQGLYTDAEYPHNLALATATEGGLVGFGLLLGALVAGTAAVLRRRPLDDNTVGFLLAALLVLVAAMFSGDYYDSRFLWFFLGLAVIAARMHHEGTPRWRGDPHGRLAGRPLALSGSPPGV